MKLTIHGPNLVDQSRAYSMKADNNHILHVIVDEIDGDEVVVHSTKSKRVRKMCVKSSLLRREITSESTAQLAAVVNGERRR